ncbi:unnamed protein product [Heligmosomoides polygyrus]|uniref:Ovule protein n=1 Tax=Heligmosomoides polygyrus TaxID=6339 RepID=A0A183GGJ4_HELPZ|nr:unnamed protein product [Heligmosomoides polygyrus]
MDPGNPHYGSGTSGHGTLHLPGTLGLGNFGCPMGLSIRHDGNMSFSFPLLQKPPHVIIGPPPKYRREKVMGTCLRFPQ